MQHIEEALFIAMAILDPHAQGRINGGGSFWFIQRLGMIGRSLTHGARLAGRGAVASERGLQVSGSGCGRRAGRGYWRYCSWLGWPTRLRPIKARARGGRQARAAGPERAVHC